MRTALLRRSHLSCRTLSGKAVGLCAVEESVPFRCISTRFRRPGETMILSKLALLHLLLLLNADAVADDVESRLFVKLLSQYSFHRGIDIWLHYAQASPLRRVIHKSAYFAAAGAPHTHTLTHPECPNVQVHAPVLRGADSASPAGLQRARFRLGVRPPTPYPRARYAMKHIKRKLISPTLLRRDLRLILKQTAPAAACCVCVPPEVIMVPTTGQFCVSSYSESYSSLQVVLPSKVPSNNIENN